MPGKSGKPKKPPPKRSEPLRIDLPFDEAIRAVLQVPPAKQNPEKKVRQGKERT